MITINSTERLKYFDDVLILLKTGLRISELCGLTVADIDFKNEVVIIDHQLLKSKEQGYYIIIGLAYNPVLYERVTAACKNRAAPGAAMTGKGHNGTPVQPQPCLRSE